MLESYITPLLMGYVNKYIKNLKPSDLSLSVWGGDVVLQNLELHLDVLQKELDLPVKFLSGKIHELRIHVPWTRITYEPVAITINTIEFIVKLRDPDEANDNDEEDNEENRKEMKKELQKAKVQREAEHLSPGYVQGVLNKVINNITVCVNNLILKYVEDDIVFSLNIKSASLFSANENWEKAFIELALPSLCLRKICNINDLTVCLDNRNAGGKIEMYQDPLLYKCNLSCRILSKYQGIGSSTAYENHVNLYCESLDMSATDLQLPMLVRLLKMCLGLYYRTLDLPGCNYKEHPAKDILEERKHKEALRTSVSKTSNDNLDDSSWTSWAWSKMPYFSDDLNDPQDFISSYDHESVLVFAIYVTQCSLTLKAIEEMSNKSFAGSRRFEFSPVLNIEMSGCAVEMLIKGEEFFDCQLGISNIVGYLIGDCLCKKGKTTENTPNVSFDDFNGDDEDELFLRIGSPTETPEDGIAFLKNSLFSQANDPSEYAPERIKLPQKGSQFTETEVVKKFSAFFLDYFYTLELPDNMSFDSSDSKQTSSKDSELVKETSSKRLIVGKCQTFFTSKLHHLITKVIAFCSEDEIPPKKVKDKPYIDPFVVEQLKSGSVPIRFMHFTCHSACFQISFADHAFRTAGNISESIHDISERNSLHGLILQIDRLDYQVNSPMFSAELNYLIDNDNKTSSMLYRAAFSDYYLKTFGMQAGLFQYSPDHSEPTTLNIIAPVHASFYLKSCINKRVGKERFTMELRAETPSISLSLTKAHVLMMTNLCESWSLKHPLPINECLIGDIFQPKANKEGISSVLDLFLIGVQGKYIQTDTYHAISGSMGSIKAAIQALCDNATLSTAIIHGPLNTAKLSDAEIFFNSSDEELLELPNGALVNLKAQFPTTDSLSDEVSAVVLFELKGIALNIDPVLLKWIDYMPTSSSDIRVKTFQRKTSKMLSRTMSMSTPKKKSYSRVYGTSQLSRERNKANKTLKKEQGECENKKPWENKMAYAMLILKSLIVKAEVETIAVFMPTKTLLTEQEGSNRLYNIPYMVRTKAKTSPEKFPNCLILTFPQLRLSSSNIKDLENTTDIPVTLNRNKPVDDSLPWALNGQGFSIYTITPSHTNSLPNNEGCYIWEPAVWTMFLAASHTDPKVTKDAQSTFTSFQDSLSLVGVKPIIEKIEDSSFDDRSQPSLGFCIHIDLASVMISISRQQVLIVLEVLSKLVTTLKNFNNRSTIKNPVRTMNVEMNLNQQSETNSAGQKSTFTEDDRRSISSTSTVEPLDDATISNEASISKFPVQRQSKDDLFVSLWLQWIIPKMSITLYSDTNIQNGGLIYKIPIELDELSFAVDYQKGKVQMTNKIGALVVRNYILRTQNDDWETDKFDGILLSCKDILGSNIESLSSSKQSNSRSFFSMTYSRVQLSDVHSRSRYASVRSEAALSTEDQDAEDTSCKVHQPSKYVIDENEIYQHKVSVSVQPFNVIAVLEPVVNVFHSILDVDIAANLPGKTDPVKPTGSGKFPRECVFQPLPVIKIESQGIRILVPALLHSDNGCEENMVVFCLQSLAISTDPENRINSTVFNKELFRCLKRHHREKSRRTKIWHVQYKVDLKGMSLWTCQWDNIFGNDIDRDEELSLIAEQQNPALEWNYEIPKRKDPVQLTPVLLDFNSSAIVSPALTVSMKDQNNNIRLTATSLELDFPKELKSFLNPSQVSLLAEVVHAISRSFQDDKSERSLSESESCIDTKTPDVIDSGVASVLSAKVSELSKDRLKSHPQDAATPSEIQQFEVLITAKNIDISLSRNQNSDNEIQELHKAVLYCQIIQPSINISWFEEKSLEVAIHDVLVSSTSNDAWLCGLLPDKESYNQSLVRTDKGKPNAKTGLFPSAFLLRYTSNKSVDVTIEVGRPVMINFYFGLPAELASFTNEISLPGSDKDSTDYSGTKLGCHVDSLALKTNRISLEVSKSSSALITKLRSLQGTVSFKKNQQFLDSVLSKFDVEGLEVLVKKNEDIQTLLSPCICDFDCQADFIKHSGNIKHESIIPKLTLCITSGFIRLRFGQQQYEFLSTMLNNLSTSEEPQMELCKEKDNKQSDEDHVEAAMPCNVEHSFDDLRMRPFQYIVHNGKDRPSHPSPNQIIFSEEDDGKPPTMTWRYPLPRFLTEVNIIPLPFHVDETASPEDEPSEIPCVIRYWDNIEQNYITYGHFFLSQTEPFTVLFPDPTETTSENAVAAEEWQVVVDVAIESEKGEQSNVENIPSDILERVTSIYKTPVSSISLAACMKINSCYLPSKIPYLSCSATIGCLQIALLNHFNASESEQSPRFSPFFLDPFTYPAEQEAILIKLNDISCKTSHLGGSTPLHSISFELDLGVDVMSYDNLSWRKCLSVSTIMAGISMGTDSEKKRTSANSLLMQNLKTSFDIEAIEMYLSQTIVHTIIMTSDHWLNYHNKETHTPLLNHYIICNETEDILRFGQIGTDEDLVLSSGQMYPYCWRSPHDQSLHLCIDSIGDWKWTNPFNIDDESAFTRTIQHNTHQSVLHIEVNRISGIQKQIVIKGGVIFRNCLSKDVEFEVVLHHSELVGSLQQQKITQVVKHFLVPSGTARPSVSCSPGTIIAIYLRFSGNEGSHGWTTSLPLSEDEIKDVSIPLTLQDRDGTKNCWYSVTSIQNALYTQLQVCVCPLFIIRNHLCWPVTMTSTSRDSGDKYTCFSHGQGKETEVFGLDSSTWYNVTFQLEGTNECTNPPLAVNTTFIDILKKKQTADCRNFIFENEWPYVDGCSIPEEEPPKIVLSSSSSSSQPSSSLPESSTDLKCQLLQRWAYLPTIVIEIKPKFIIHNSSSMDLVLRDPEMSLTWELIKSAAVTSPAIQSAVQFGIQRKDMNITHWSSEVRLTDHVKPHHVNHERANEIEEIMPHSAISFSIIDIENSCCYQFAISSKKRDGITVINITERFCIHNCTDIQLICLPVMSADQIKESRNGAVMVIPDSKDPLFLSKVSLDRPAETKGNFPDFSQLELKFCFSVDGSLLSTSFDDQQIFNLSHEHLRENIVLNQRDGKFLLLAVTSYCQNGVINIFIDKERCPSFIFLNQTGHDLLIRSINDHKWSTPKHRHVDPAEHQEERIQVCAGGSMHFQPKSFNKRFPRIDNSRTGSFQIAVFHDLTVFSNEIEINGDMAQKQFNIGSVRICLSCQQSSNTFHVFLTNVNTSIPSVRHSILFPIINLNASKISLIIMDYKPSKEIIAVTIKDVSVGHEITSIESGFLDDTESLISLDIGSIQIDNQLTDDYGHFPVVFLPLREASQRYRGEVSQNAPLADEHASPMSSFCHVNTKLYSSDMCPMFVKEIKLIIQPVEIYLEDSFIYHIINVLNSFSPPRVHKDSSNNTAKDEAGLRAVANQILCPVNIGRIEVSDVKILLSIHASVKMYLAADHMPIVLGKFDCKHAVTTYKELSRYFLYHYATEALVRAGLMIGSLEILANPTGFIRSIGQGIVDFFSLPYDGLTRGPSAFVTGITRGMGSFVRHTSVGALTSMTNFASSLSRNLDRLSMDENHVVWQEEHRRRVLSQPSPGFRDALSSLAVSLLGALAGIVDHPITNIQNADDTKEAVKGAVTGLGKGLVGLVTKPLGGAMELVSQTGQGILLGTGLVIPPKKVRLPLTEEEFKEMEIDSFMKYCWKVIRLDFEQLSNLFIIDDVFVTSVSDKHGYKGAIILTISALYLFDKDVNNIRKAFSCNEIILRPSQDGPHGIIIESLERTSVEYGLSGLSEKPDCSNRVDHKAAVSNGQSYRCFPVYLQMNPRFASSLLSEFSFQRNMIDEKLADELETMNITILNI